MNDTKTIERRPNRGGVARIWRLATKELRETLRDRRTIVTLIFMPLLVYPILSLIFQNFLLSSLGEVQDSDDPKFTILLATNLPQNESTSYLNRISTQVAEFEKEIGEKQSEENSEDAEVVEDEDQLAENLAVEDELLDYRVVEDQSRHNQALSDNNWIYVEGATEEDVAQIVAQGDADVGLIVKIDDEGLRIEELKIFQRESLVSSEAAAYLKRQFRQWNNSFVDKMFRARGGKLPAVEPLVKRIEIKQGRTAGGTIASMIPLALVLMTITGAVYPAIDLTAGERERGTLETLMAAPIPRMSILFAKFIAVVTVAVLTAILNLVGMTIVMWVFQLDQMLPGGGLTVGIIFKVFLLLVLFAVFFAACLLMVTSFARSFKEAQAYLVPIILLSLGPGLLATSPNITLSGLTTVTPMMNLLVLARDVMTDQVQTGAAVIAVISTLVYAFVALSIAARMFGADTILYSQQLSLSSLVTRPKRTSAFVPVVAALLCLVLLLPINMVSIGVLGRIGKTLSENFSLFCLLMATFTAFSFFVIPSFVAWINRVNFKIGFGLNGTSTTYFIAAVILGLSLWPIVMLMVEGTYAIYGMMAGEAAAGARHEMLVKLSEEQVVRFRQVSPAIIALCFSLIPAFCEEWFFRGMLLRALAKEWKAWSAILTTAVLFGVFHILSNSAISLDRFLPTMLIGILLGYIAWKSNSIWPSFILHALHNGTVAFLGYYQESLSELPWFPQEAEKIPTSWGLIACLVAGVGIAIIVKATRQADVGESQSQLER